MTSRSNLVARARKLIVKMNEVISNMLEEDKEFRPVMTLIGQWMDAMKPISTVNTNTVQSLGISTKDQFTYISPQLTKEVYYSPFVHKTLPYTVGGNPYLAMKLVYCMAMTTLPTKWFHGKNMALEHRAQQNVVSGFAEGMTGVYGSVSVGERINASQVMVVVRRRI